MGSIMRKEFFKEIKNTLGQFISILLIVALGVGFFAGIRATGPDFRETAENYFEETNFMDIQVQGNYGLTQTDIDAIASYEGVEEIEAAYQYDALFDRADETYVVRFHSFTGAAGEEGVMNGLVLLEGRLPENPGECVLKKSSAQELANTAENGLAIGDSLTVYSGKTDEELSDSLKNDTYEIVGVVRSPLFITSLVESTNVGTGTVNSQAFIMPSEFSMDYYTTAYIRGTGLADLPFYEDAYETKADGYVDGLEALGEEEAPRRLEELVADLQEDIDDAQQELDDAKADAEAQLETARVELADAQTKLTDGEAEYAKAKQEFDDDIADAETQLADAATELADAKQTLDDGEAEYADGLTQYNDGARQYRSAEKNATQTLADAKIQLDAAKAQLDTAKAQLDASKTQLDSGWAQLTAGENQLAAAQVQIDQASKLETLLNSVVSQGAYFTADQSAAAVGAATAYDPSLGAAVEAHLQAVQAGMASPTETAIRGAISSIDAQVVTGQADINTNAAVLATSRTQLDAAQAQYDAGYAQYAQGLQEYNEGYKEYSDGTAQLMSAKKDLDDARAQLDSARVELDDGWVEYNDGLAEYNTSLEDFNTAKADGEQQLADAAAELATGRTTLEDAQTTFSEKEQELVDTVAENQKKIDDGQKDLDDFLDDADASKWTVTMRSDTNQVIQYIDTTESMDTISTIFPVFFLVIAVLVCLTTMTRMVEDQRGQIGTLKAMGYSKATIVAKYLIYASIACVLGSILGLVVGFQLFPQVIYTAYSQMLYQMPKLVPPFRWNLAIGTTFVALFCILLATYSVCRASLKEQPAELMRPKAPPKGKRILLERIGFLWKHLNFTWKVTMRNLFRYKKRMLMTIIGIAGCTGLMLTGFGLRDEVRDITGLQFSEINHTSLTVILNTNATDEDVALYEQELAANENIKESMVVDSDTVTLSKDGTDEEATLVVPSDMELFPSFITLQERVSKNPVSLSDTGVILSEKISKIFSLKVGDEITLELEDHNTVTVTVEGIVENYMFNYVYMSPTLYESLYDETPSYHTGYVMLQDDLVTESGEQQVADQIMKIDSVLTITTSSSLSSLLNNQIGSINTVILVLVISAALLAFVVMYNLSSININERKREIATIKLLGFYNNEVSDYVFRETIILSIIGAGVGLIVGIYLLRFVSATAEPNMIMFGQDIKPLSYVYSVGLTMIFTLLVQGVAYGILKRIDMIDSLKSVE